MKLALVFGTRPQIIKCVPVIRECIERKIDLVIVNTGQHYDFELSKIFFQGLDVPPPKYDLGIGSGSHSWQTGNIMIAVEKALREIKPSVCLVPGDTNSAIGAALAAVKLKISVAHLESGLRSHEEFMPEEINRKAIDHICQLLFAPTQNAKKNLLVEGIAKKKVVLSGDTMYDLYLRERERIEGTGLPEGAIAGQYAVATIHREENTDEPERLGNILDAIKRCKTHVILPMHPRTRERLKQFNLINKAKSITHLSMIDPLGYHAMMKLMQNSLFVMTDSGGMQKEAFMVQVPCITLRHSTEWIDTVNAGANFLVSRMGKDRISDIIGHVTKNRREIVRMIKKAKNPFGDGMAAPKVIEEIIKRF